VGCVIPNLYKSDRGIRLPPGTPGEHEAHFLDSTGFTENFLSLNTAVATQLTLLPIASPASGFTYTFDRMAGVFTRTADSFGPVLAERGETIGRGRFFFAVTYQRFRFETVDGEDLDSLPAVFEHIPVGRATSDIVSSVNRFDLHVDQFALFGTVGVTNNFDVSVAVPILDVRLSASSVSTIRRIATANADCPPNSTEPCHFFDINNRAASVNQEFRNEGSATGIGDVTLRFKYNVKRFERASIAVASELRLPTGDERDFLGSGAVGIKPFVALSLRSGRFAPHVNVGYQWNGDSVLAGDLVTGTEGNLPDAFFYAAGADISVTKWVTAAIDFLGQRLFDAPEIVTGNYTAQNGSVFPIVSSAEGSFSLNDISFGIKLNPFKELLVTGNAIFRLDDSGLRQRVTPMIGVSYSF
jgi:hypothetical protein